MNNSNSIKNKSKYNKYMYDLEYDKKHYKKICVKVPIEVYEDMIGHIDYTNTNKFVNDLIIDKIYK